MPKARLLINKGLPARWSIRRQAFYYSVPPGLELQWDGKKLFRLGSTQYEAYAEWTRRLGKTVPIGRTVAAAVSRYMSEVSPLKASASHTNDQYSAKRIGEVFDVRPLAALTPSEAYGYIDKRGAPGQARKEIAFLSAVLTECVRWGWLPSNQLLNQIRTRKVEKVRRYITDEEFLQAVEIAVPWLKAYLWLKLATGLRQKDMCRLLIGDFHGGELRVIPSKTARSTQVQLIFELDPSTRAEVVRVLAGRSEVSGFLFATTAGGPYGKDSFHSAWSRLMVKVEKAGGRRFNEHDVRGKAGSDAATVESARRLLGHASSAVTMRHYRRAAERIKAGG